MVRNVLIVDDDRIWLRMLQKKLSNYQQHFEPILAGDGTEALEVLQSKPVSLVVTDMQMPKMDGLTLLAHLSGEFPDIPVIVVTAYSTPKLKRTVLERGGAGYIEKPFVVEDLARKITAMLNKESEGGTLQTVPLEMFIQLIEMEQKTCTIRVFNKPSREKGVLFFRSGDLLDARLQEKKGLPAAHAIFSWEEVSLTIQDTCPVEEKKIDKELQAILLDAMRLKDEGEHPELEIEEEGEEAETAGPELDPRPQNGPRETRKEPAPPSRPTPKKLPSGNGADMELQRLEARLREERGFVKIYRDGTWNDRLAAAGMLSDGLNAGPLQLAFVSGGDGDNDRLLIPTRDGGAAIVVELDPKSARDRVLDALPHGKE